MLLPCNVIVSEQDDQSVVTAIDADKMMTVVNDPQLVATAGQVNDKLLRMIKSL